MRKGKYSCDVLVRHFNKTSEILLSCVIIFNGWIIIMIKYKVTEANTLTHFVLIIM